MSATAESTTEEGRERGVRTGARYELVGENSSSGSAGTRRTISRELAKRDEGGGRRRNRLDAVHVHRAAVAETAWKLTLATAFSMAAVRRLARFLPDVCFISSRVHVASHACSQIRDHVRAFLLGSTTALSIGYYKVHQSLWESTASVSGHLEKLGEETTHSQTVLQQRVALLEAEVAKLKEKLDAQ
jgi:hypothetical protein